MVVVFQSSRDTEYQSGVCSKAFVFYLACAILTSVPPLLIAYRSEGFWKKLDFFQEQPDVHFKHEFLLVLETNDLDKCVTWSTMREYNELAHDFVRVPKLKSAETDWNRDGKMDRLDLRVDMPLKAGENVYGVKLFLLFDVKFKLYSKVRMEGLAFVQEKSGLPGAKLSVTGDLSLVQKQLLLSRGRDDRFAGPVFGTAEGVLAGSDEDYDDVLHVVEENRDDDHDEVDDARRPYYSSDSRPPWSSLERFNFDRVLRNYNRRNVTVRLGNDYMMWERSSSDAAAFFTIKARINYPVQTVAYRPGFWQMIKWAWVQYLAVLVIFLHIFHGVKTFVYTNQVVNTRTVTPGAPCDHGKGPQALLT